MSKIVAIRVKDDLEFHIVNKSTGKAQHELLVYREGIGYIGAIYFGDTSRNIQSTVSAIEEGYAGGLIVVELSKNS